MSRSLKNILVIFMVLYALPSLCQDFPMVHYTVDDGLPSNLIYNVYRDSKGYLWFGTDKGIARYNGIRFEKFTTFDGLADNDVFSSKEDYYGRLWFATYNGNLCYYQDGVFHTAANTAFLKLPYKAFSLSFYAVNKDSSITVNFYDKGLLLNIYKDRVVEHLYKDMEGEFGMPDTRFLQGKRKIAPDLYQFTCFDSLDLIVDTNYHLRKVINRPDSRKLYYLASQDETYWLNKDYIYTDDKKVVRAIKEGFFDANLIHVYYADSVNWFWGTINGLFINDSIRVLNSDNVTCLTQDNVGNYWVTTLNDGAYCIKKEFLTTRIIKNAYEGVVKYHYRDSSHFLFTVSGNDLLSLENGKVNFLFNYRDYKKIDYKYRGIDAAYMIEKRDNDYNYYNYYNDDNLVIKNLFSPEKKLYKYPSQLEKQNVKGMFLANNSLYIRTRIQIFCVDNSSMNEGKKMEPIYNCVGPDFKIFTMAQAPDQTMYFSTLNGVYKIDKNIVLKQPQFKNVAFKNMGIFGNYLLGTTQDNRLLICNNFNGNIVIDSAKVQDCIWQDFYRLDSSHVLVGTNNLYRIISLFPSRDTPKYSIQTVGNLFVPLDPEAVSSDGKDCYFFKNGNIVSTSVKSLLEKTGPPELAFTTLKTAKKTLRH